MVVDTHLHSPFAVREINTHNLFQHVEHNDSGENAEWPII